MLKTRICKLKFDSKPAADAVAGISMRISTCANKELTLEEFADHIGSGGSFSPAHYSEGRSSKGFLRSNTLCLDYDEGNYSLDALLSNFEYKPAITYESFSSSKENRKWRLIFKCDRDLTNVAELKENLMSLAAGTPYDKACVDAARLFFGTNKRVRVFYDHSLVRVTKFQPVIFEPVIVPEESKPRTEYSSRKANKVVDACERLFYRSVGKASRRQIVFYTATKFLSSGLFTTEQVEKYILSFAKDFDQLFLMEYDKSLSQIIEDCSTWIQKR